VKAGDLVKFTDACCRQHKINPKKLLNYYGIGIILFIDNKNTLRIKRNQPTTVHVHWEKQGTEWEIAKDLEVVSEGW